MRAYKFLDQKYGLKTITERRLRRTRIGELNDPFELRPYDLSNTNHRWAFDRTRNEIAQRFGLLCFSANWTDPVIWAHYADKHRGLCLGFEILAAKTKKVYYIREPLPFPKELIQLEYETKFQMAEKMIYTKFSNWEYEREIRTFTDLEEGFFNFCDELQLVEVFVGAECRITEKTVNRALGSLANDVSVKKVRAAYATFQMVEDMESKE